MSGQVLKTVYITKESYLSSLTGKYCFCLHKWYIEKCFSDLKKQKKTPTSPTTKLKMPRHRVFIMWSYLGSFQTDTLVVIPFFIKLFIEHDNDIGAQAVTRYMVTRQDKMNKNYAGIIFTKIVMNWFTADDQIYIKSI